MSMRLYELRLNMLRCVLVDNPAGNTAVSTPMADLENEIPQYNPVKILINNSLSELFVSERVGDFGQMGLNKPRFCPVSGNQVSGTAWNSRFR